MTSNIYMNYKLRNVVIIQYVFVVKKASISQRK